jgi:hypothetical protein
MIAGRHFSDRLSRKPIKYSGSSGLCWNRSGGVLYTGVRRAAFRYSEVFNAYFFL